MFFLHPTVSVGKADRQHTKLTVQLFGAVGALAMYWKTPEILCYNESVSAILAVVEGILGVRFIIHP